MKIATAVFVLGLLGGAGYGVYYVATQKAAIEKEDGTDKKKDGKKRYVLRSDGTKGVDRDRPDLPDTGLGVLNCDLPVPDGWTEDDVVRKRMRMKLAYTRNGENYFALEIVKYQHRVPGVPVLIDHVMSRARRQFTNLAWEPKRPATLEGMERNGKLADERSLILEFLGDRDDVVYTGEIHLMDYRGIHYWLMTWTPNDVNAAANKDEWELIRESFVLGDKRKGWSPRGRRSFVARGRSGGYVLECPEEVWKKDEELAKYEVGHKVDLVLIGSDPQKDYYAGEIATVRVMLAEEKQSNLDDAQAYARRRLTQYFADEKLENVKERVLDGDDGIKRDVRASLVRQNDGQVKLVPWKRETAPGEQAPRYVEPALAAGSKKVTDLHVTHLRAIIEGQTYDHYFLLVTANLPHGTVIVQAECIWERGEYWTPELYDLIRTLEPR